MTVRNRPMRTRAGGVVQAGLDARLKGTLPIMRMPTLVPYRAIVLNTYVTDEDENRSGIAVECDVILVRANFRLARVPVKQANHGRNNAWAPWIPRPSTRVISTGAAVNFTTRTSRGTAMDEAPLLSDLDGDLVIVEFMEGDPDRPLITGALSHDANLRRVVGPVDDADAALGWKEGDYRQGSPRRNEYFISHYGSELRINGQGDVLVSTVGAFDDPTNEDATVEKGHVRFRVKNSRRFTVEMDGTDVLEVWKDGGQVKIDLGEGASQRLILGDDFKTFLNNWLSTKFDLHVHVAGTLVVGTDAVTGATGVATGFTGTQMDDTLLSDLARTKKT